SKSNRFPHHACPALPVQPYRRNKQAVGTKHINCYQAEDSARILGFCISTTGNSADGTLGGNFPILPPIPAHVFAVGCRI
ncbi:MAG: hypothetical protein KDA99_29025, partial [Planctomycetales bacterium]|nr:hypothetical protein [Planctomycetales bacterium]